MGRGERETLHQLMANKSESAWIICRLQGARPIVRAVLDELRENCDARVNFVSIPASTRFKYGSKQGLAPAKCANSCSNADNYLHLLDCHQIRRLGNQELRALISRSPWHAAPHPPIHARLRHSIRSFCPFTPLEMRADAYDSYTHVFR